MSFVKRGLRLMLHLVILLLFFDILFAGFAHVDPQNMSANLLSDIYENANDVSINKLDSSFDNLCLPNVQKQDINITQECERVDELKQICENKELYQQSAELDDACLLIESGEFEKSCEKITENNVEISFKNPNCNALNEGAMSHKEFFVNYTLSASSSIEQNTNVGILQNALSHPWFSTSLTTILLKLLFMILLLVIIYFIFGQMIFLKELEKLFLSVPIMILLTTVIVFGFQYLVEPDTSGLLDGSAQTGELMIVLLPLAFSQFLTFELFALAGACLAFWILLVILVHLKKSRESL